MAIKIKFISKVKDKYIRSYRAYRRWHYINSWVVCWFEVPDCNLPFKRD